MKLVSTQTLKGNEVNSLVPEYAYNLNAKRNSIVDNIATAISLFMCLCLLVYMFYKGKKMIIESIIYIPCLFVWLSLIFSQFFKTFLDDFISFENRAKQELSEVSVHIYEGIVEDFVTTSYNEVVITQSERFGEAKQVIENIDEPQRTVMISGQEMMLNEEDFQKCVIGGKIYFRKALINGEERLLSIEKNIES